MASIYIVPVVVLALLLIGYPVYFIVGRTRAKRAGRRGPSVVTAAAWVLVLLMAVVLIIPIWRSSSARSKVRIDVRINLSGLARNQKVYFWEYKEYPSTFTIQHWEPEGWPSYFFFSESDEILATYGNYPLDGIDEIHAGRWPFYVRPAADEKGYTVVAVGNIDGDPFPDVWTLNDAEEIRNIMDDTRDYDARDLDPNYLRASFLLAALLVFIGLVVRDAVVIQRTKRVRIGQGKVDAGE